MNKFLPILILLAGLQVNAQGYEIKVKLTPFKNQYIYLGSYYGKQLPIVDSALLNDEGEAVFKGNDPLGGGIYLVGYPDKSGFFEILVDKQQQFSIVADTSDVLKNIRFTNSPDNVLFNQYQQFMQQKGRSLDSAMQLRKTNPESAELKEHIEKTNEEIKTFRHRILNNEPNSMMAFLLTAMREPEVPLADKHPGGKYDSVYAYKYYKDQYWEGVNFFDDRLARTPFFENKLDRYFEQIVVQQPDSIIKEIDWMMGYASANEEMQKFLMLKFINRYLNQKYMWEDAVFVHLYTKYLSQKDYPWLTENGKKTITDRAYNLMANIFGNPAADINLPDSTGKNVSLYSVEAPFTVVFIWDPTCGHCKEVAPKIDSLYNNKWKKAGIKIYALAKETDGSKSDWLKYISENKLQWQHVYYSKEADKARINAGTPGYSQLYDVQSFPTIYLLDKEKRIIAKKLAFDQIDEILDLKLKDK
ncbi:MAG: DUF5106 domain-containing protein [Chitinophagaceae bacterium]|jgi:thiol-disulfide isomerase/thioredoxin|nr:DUF5106 domain-containing protein [Chitinophagaceae bacterium]